MWRLDAWPWTTVHRRHIVEIPVPRSSDGHNARAAVQARASPLARYVFLLPAGCRWSASGRGPEDGEVSIIAICTGAVRHLFQIREIRTKPPCSRVSGISTVAAQEDLTARFAIEKLKNSSAAGAARRGQVVKRAHWARIQPWRCCVAAGVSACPQPLDIPEHDVRTDRQHRVVGRSPGSAYTCNDTLCGRARVVIAGNSASPICPSCWGRLRIGLPAEQAKRRASTAPALISAEPRRISGVADGGRGGVPTAASNAVASPESGCFAVKPALRATNAGTWLATAARRLKSIACCLPPIM